ncbi:hypothetical protein ACFPRL_26740 [Pseudoclavibacter helvolus]
MARPTSSRRCQSSDGCSAGSGRSLVSRRRARGAVRGCRFRGLVQRGRALPRVRPAFESHAGGALAHRCGNPSPDGAGDRRRVR